MTAIYEQGLAPNAANHVALTPLGFLDRAAATWPDKVAVIHGPGRITYGELGRRCRRLASALAARGIGPGDTVSILAPNVPALLEAHYGVPMTGAVLNAINARLDAATVAFILRHSGARAFLVDRDCAAVARTALAEFGSKLLVVDLADPLGPATGGVGDLTYEALLGSGDPDFAWHWPDDEWSAIALNYTSGTTGNPKGVVCHHRGAFLNAIGNAITFGLGPETVYLWTLPMFHCNGWCYTWAVTAVGGTHVCLRRVDPLLIFPAIGEHRVTHLCAAPVVLNLLVHAPDTVKRRFDHVVEVATGGAAPPSAVIAAMSTMGFHVTHLYGLTEVYGPSTLCAWQDAWDGLDADAQATRMARQGVNLLTMAGQDVIDPATSAAVPADGATIGELVLRGNTVMKGYFKNRAASDEAFRDGWFHTGDLAVKHPDGYVEIKDRAKDIIISGGENISSLEVEEVLYRHPRVMEAAVVTRPDAKWGESPCAFVTLKPGAAPTTEAEILAFCRERMARFKLPRTVVFGPLPKTSTGKIQKFQLREQARALGERQDA
ncbi:MAG: acyl-CoA synthetase [Alphaproteobacteria bacterium]|nr:acyl-CoA synthetase [Alphaproteobacteria bacterium]